MKPQKLATKVVGWQLVFSAGSALTLYFLMPALLLLDEDERRAASLSLSLAVLIAGAVSLGQGWGLIWARRKLLTNLSDPPGRTHHHIDLPKLNDDPWHIVNAWLYSSMASVALSMTLFRPSAVPAGDGVILAVFAAVILAAASLPLFLLVRGDFVRLMEQVPPDIMAEIIDAQVRSRRLRGRTSRRLLAAMATPVALLVIGNALISGAHVRSLEQKMRTEAARSVAEAVLSRTDAEKAHHLSAPRGASEVLQTLSEAGFLVHLRPEPMSVHDIRTRHGVVQLSIPLDGASAQVLFRATTAWSVSPWALSIAFISLLAAIWVGMRLGRYLSHDLRMANHGVRMLGTDAALEGTRVMKPARFLAVAELGTAIESLANRFRLFARAQEKAISARSAATQARGRFFASVSHDLKSPLNAILGFAEITRRDPTVNEAQRESLDTILQRGRELLTLIETILDAARVEAGQLHLDIQDESIDDLLEESLDRARTLTSQRDVLVRFNIPENVPALAVDRLRLSQAIATFIAHARRTAERDSMRVLVETEPPPPGPTLMKRKVTIYIEIPSAEFSAKDLEGMLHPETHPGQHRGLSLALRLAKSIIALHGGQVTVTGRTVREPAFAIHMFGMPGK